MILYARFAESVLICLKSSNTYRTKAPGNEEPGAYKVFEVLLYTPEFDS